MIPDPSFTHLRRLTDAGGLYEHAEGTRPRREHGYCVDDVARALVVLSRESDPGLAGLHEGYLRFVLDAQTSDGRFRNRRDRHLAWTDQPTVEDCWGRALWGLGAAGGDARALHAFERGARWRSPHRRAMAFAALGAAEVLARRPGHGAALALLADAAGLLGAAQHVGAARGATGWIWPEARLSYANAAVAEALICAGDVLADPAVLAVGLRLLGWLLDEQTRDGHLSVVPVGGRGPVTSAHRPPGQRGPVFDQQPIEVAALADACARAHALDGQDRWLTGIELAVSWFLGANDAGTALYDPVSGGGCDGLERTGRNENQGAESTLALLSTLQHGRRLALTPA